MSFFTEIRRRKVFQVATVYAVVAWLVIQIVDVVNAPLSLPAWFDTFVIVVFAIGFPIAVILAWAFDVTPQGIRTTAEAPVGNLPAQSAGQKLNYVTHGLVLLAVGFLLADQYLLQPQAGSNADVPDSSPGPMTNTVINLPPDAPLALGAHVPTQGFDSPAIAVARDGTRLAYVGNTGSGTMLYLRDMAGGDVRPLSGTEDAINPFFSPDGAWIGFLTRGQVKKVSLLTGAVSTLADASLPVQGWWTDNDTIYFSEDAGWILSRVAADGGSRADRVITRTLRDVLSNRIMAKYSDVLPGGRAALVTKWVNSISGDYAEIVLIDFETLEAATLIKSAYGARYLTSGHLIFARGGNLMAIRFDLAHRELVGDEIQVATSVGMESLFGQVHAAVSDNGLLVFAPGGDRTIGKLTWVDRDGSIEVLEGAPARTYGVVDLARDGSRLAAHVAGVTDYIWVYDFDSGVGRRIAANESYGWPILRPPNGRELLSYSLQTGNFALEDIDSGRETGQFSEDVHDGRASGSWSPAGDALMYSTTLEQNIRFVSMDGKVESTDIKGAWPNGFSPDGSFFAYNDTSSNEIWVASRANPELRRRISDRGIETVWCPCGELFYRDGNRWYSTRVTTEPELSFDRPRLAFETTFIDTPGISYAVSVDGQRLLVVKHADSDGQMTLQVVTNWQRALDASPR